MKCLYGIINNQLQAAFLLAEFLPTARVMTPRWFRISWTTWLFCSGVERQQITALHRRLRSRKLLLNSSSKAQPSVRPSMTRMKLLDMDSPFPVRAVKLSPPWTSSMRSSNKAAQASWRKRKDCYVPEQSVAEFIAVIISNCFFHEIGGLLAASEFRHGFSCPVFYWIGLIVGVQDFYPM